MKRFHTCKLHGFIRMGQLNSLYQNSNNSSSQNLRIYFNGYIALPASVSDFKSDSNSHPSIAISGNCTWPDKYRGDIVFCYRHMQWEFDESDPLTESSFSGPGLQFKWYF
jgi:hypothetical protein